MDDAVTSAENARGGSRWMILRPIVRITRQPPEYVPSEMALAAEMMTHSGRSSPADTWPVVSRARKMTPIVFWASCRPWPNAIAAADTVWAILKPRLTRPGLRRRNTHMIVSINANAITKPTTGDTTIGTRTLSLMAAQSTKLPDARAAPTRPPIKAWEDDDGRPKYHVVRFQLIAPTSPASTTTSPWFPEGGVITSETVLATPWPSRAPAKFITA